MKMKDQLQGDVVVIDVAGKVMASNELTLLRGKIQYYLELHKRRFVVDFRRVDWMNSTGLGALIASNASIQQAGGKLALANITNIQNLLNITQLVRFFSIFDSRDDALRAVSPQSSSQLMALPH